MPVIKSAKKKLRQDKKRTAQNAVFEEAFKKTLKAAKKSPTDSSVRSATKAIDKAVKHHLLHKNKAARVKSSLSKLLAGKGTPHAVSSTQAKKTKAKSATKKSSPKKAKKSSK